MHLTNYNPTVIKKVLKACRIAQKRDTVEHVLNCKGQAFLAVRKVKVNDRIMFKVTDKNGINQARKIGNYTVNSAALQNKHNIARFALEHIAYNFEIEQNKPSIPLMKKAY